MLTAPSPGPIAVGRSWANTAPFIANTAAMAVVVLKMDVITLSLLGSGVLRARIPVETMSVSGLSSLATPLSMRDPPSSIGVGGLRSPSGSAGA